MWDAELSIVPRTIPTIISKEAIIAAQDFVNVCCQHAAYISGRRKVDDEIGQLTAGIILGLPLLHVMCLTCINATVFNQSIGSLASSSGEALSIIDIMAA